MKQSIKIYLRNLAIAVDQFVNAALGGCPDETLSSRLYRKDREADRGEASKYWTGWRVTVDMLFFWQDNHCEKSYLREKQKAHFPRDLQ